MERLHDLQYEYEIYIEHHVRVNVALSEREDERERERERVSSQSVVRVCGSIPSNAITKSHTCLLINNSHRHDPCPPPLLSPLVEQSRGDWARFTSLREWRCGLMSGTCVF